MVNNQQKVVGGYGGHGKRGWLWKQLAQGSGELSFPDCHQGGVFFWKEVHGPSKTSCSEVLRRRGEAVAAAGCRGLCTLSYPQTWRVSAVDLKNHFTRW